MKDRRIHFIIRSALFLVKVEMRRNIFQWNQKVEGGGKGGRDGLFSLSEKFGLLLFYFTCKYLK